MAARTACLGAMACLVDSVYDSSLSLARACMAWFHLTH